MNYFTAEADFPFDVFDTESTEQSIKEIAVMNEMNLLVTRTQNNPDHSIVNDLLAILSEIMEPIDGFVGEDVFDVDDSVGPHTIENIFRSFRDILATIYPVYLSDCSDVSFRDKTDRLESYAKALVLNMEDDVSIFRSGVDPDSRLEELLDLISQLADNSDTAAVIRGAKEDALWSRLAQVADVEELLPEENEECCICTSITLTRDVNFTILSGCRHLLCQPCAGTWFGIRSTCPLCRRESSKFASRDDFLQFKREQRELEMRWPS